MSIRTIIFLSFQFLAMESYGQEFIEGIWILNIDKSIQMMPSDERVRYDTLPAHVKTRARESMQYRTFRLKENAELFIEIKVRGVEKQANGKWRLNSTRKLVFEIADAVFEYSLEQPDPNVLILISDEAGGYFNSLYLERSPN